MNWLFIDTSKSGEFRVGLIGPGKPRISQGQGRSNKFLPILALRLKSVDLEKISGVCVVAGPGSFTAVRTGVLVANILARHSGKPLYGITTERAQDLVRLKSDLETGKLEPVGYVAPVYDSEPNITLKKDTGIRCYV
ncbi:MAG: hypothetical protein WC551_05080 [Patescibacteria group bacterium]